MISRLSPVGLLRPTGAGLVAAVLFALPSCGATQPLPPATPAAPVHTTFQTGNGLLYPPELWGAVPESELARFLRWRVERALDAATPAWPGDPQRTFSALAAETSEPLAAKTLLDGGVGVAALGRLCAADIAGWVDAAVIGRDIDALWLATEVAAGLGCPVRDLPSGADAILDAAAAGRDVIPAWEAAGIRARQAGSAAPPALPTAANNVRDARDAARYALLAATQTGRPVDRLPEAVRDLALPAAGDDDFVLLDLVQAQLAGGDDAAARALAGSYDPRRLRPGGRVLEHPRFEGSVGSTHRMLRWFAARGTLTDQLTVQERADMAAALRSQRDKDPVHRVTADAALVLLDDTAVDEPTRRADVAAALDAMGVASGPLTSARQALGWASLAECAESLGVRLPYPHVTDAVLHDWATVSPAEGAPSLARFLLAAHAAGATGDEPSLAPLIGRLRDHLAEADPAQVPTSTLAAGVLTVHQFTGRWAVEPATLRALLAERQDDCLGGFSGFVRETDTPDTVCNVDASLAALRLGTALNG